MSAPEQSSETLLARVGARQMIARFGRWTFLGTLAAAVVYLVALLLARLLALIPDYFEPWTVALIPGVGLVIGLIFGLRRPPAKATARQIDSAMGTKDLFLTEVLSCQGSDSGDQSKNFSPIVSAQAQKRAKDIKPAEVVTWRWQKPASVALAVVSVLLVAAFFVPQLDPLGKEEKRNLLGKRQQKLEELTQVTKKRTELLAQKKEDPKMPSPEVQKALDELKKTFVQAKPKEKKKNLSKLHANQDELNKLWRKIDAEKVKNTLPGEAMKQMLGANPSKETKEMRDALRNGDSEPLKEKLEEIKKTLEEAAKETDPAKKKEAKQKARQQMQELSNMLSKEMGSKNIDSALKRAMEQLDMSSLEGMDKEALESAMESLDLTKQEMDELAKAMKNQKALEDALSALQNAKKLAEQEKLDGSECEGCNSMADYKKRYEEMTGQSVAGKGGDGNKPGEGKDGSGNGGGMKGPGTGEGGIAPEDEGLQTSHKTEKAISALQGGKMLMEWKIKEVGDPGEARANFDDSIREIKQGVSEAIRTERIPPSYHSGIQGYFDDLENAVDGPTPPEDAGDTPEE